MTTIASIANNGHSKPQLGQLNLLICRHFIISQSTAAVSRRPLVGQQAPFALVSFSLLVALTLELFACKNSCDSNLSTIDAAGKRCINALHTRLAPAPPWRHRPVIICVVRSSKLSSGKRVMRLISSCFLASATSEFRSEESKVRSKLSKHGCTCANVSELRRASSSWATPCKR